MLKLVTVAEARQTQVNNLDENNCKVYGLFHSSKENHSAYMYVLHLALINLNPLTFTKPQRGPNICTQVLFIYQNLTVLEKDTFQIYYSILCLLVNTTLWLYTHWLLY